MEGVAVAAAEGSLPVNPSFPIHPRHPERICWGCKRYCSADDMVCGSEVERAQHPVELFGDDWFARLSPERKGET